MSSFLLGKVIIRSDIEVRSGLRIGGASGGLKIGGVDLNVITDPEGKPYIPGSSLKGKMRSLMERKEGALPNERGIHQCESKEDYKKCSICKIWGTLGGLKFSEKENIPTLTRLIVRDCYLDEDSITEEMRRNIDLQWTEVKFETAINRITGTALSGSLRQAERVPAGARFKDCEIIFNVFEEEDRDLLKKVFEAMELLEHDYLGGMGSRGYGQIEFKNIKVFWNSVKDYENGTVDLTDDRRINRDGLDTPGEIIRNFKEIKEKLTQG